MPKNEMAATSLCRLSILPGRSAKVQFDEVAWVEKVVEKEMNPNACFKCQTDEGGEFL